jgi:hypothetical protein
MSRLAALLVVTLAACATDEAAPAITDDEAADFATTGADGKADGAAVFDANDVLADDVLTNDTAMTVDDVQAFLADSPYGGASWLATATVGGQSVAQAVVDAAHADHIHPLVLIARMQVESSGVSKKPGPTALAHALGCGCPDGSACASSLAGLGNQLTCAAHLLRELYDGSIDRSAEWQKGKKGRTLDPKTVTPATHATAALYGYTPWVLTGRGGTWLVWNVTRKFLAHAAAAGLLH